MGLKTMIVNYHNKQDAIQFIKENRSSCRVSELNEVLEWAELNPKDYSNKDMKIDVIIEYLEEEYL